MDTHQLAQVDFGRGLSEAWSSIITFVPKLLAFLAILLIGWIIAKALAKAVNAVLERVGFDRVVERGGIKTMMARSKYDASDIIAKIVYYGLLLITLQIAFGVWGSNPVSDLLTSIVAFLPKAIVAIIIVIIAAAIANAVRDLIRNSLGGLSYGRLLGTVAWAFILGLGVIAALNQIDVATTVTMPVLIALLATVGGIAIVGVGGGLIEPMRQRWSHWLDRAEHEIPRMRTEAQAAERRQGTQVSGQSGTGESRTSTEERAQQPAHAAHGYGGGATGGYAAPGATVSGHHGHPGQAMGYPGQTGQTGQVGYPGQSGQTGQAGYPAPGSVPPAQAQSPNHPPRGYQAPGAPDPSAPTGPMPEIDPRRGH